MKITPYDLDILKSPFGIQAFITSFIRTSLGHDDGIYPEGVNLNHLKEIINKYWEINDTHYNGDDVRTIKLVSLEQLALEEILEHNNFTIAREYLITLHGQSSKYRDLYNVCTVLRSYNNINNPYCYKLINEINVVDTLSSFAHFTLDYNIETVKNYGNTIDRETEDGDDVFRKFNYVGFLFQALRNEMARYDQENVEKLDENKQMGFDTIHKVLQNIHDRVSKQDDKTFNDDEKEVIDLYEDYLSTIK